MFGQSAEEGLQPLSLFARECDFDPSESGPQTAIKRELVRG
jgi:hypothetical protein